MHPLIQEFLRVRFAETAAAGVLKQTYCQVMVEIAQQTPQTPTRNQILALTPLIPHLQEAARPWQDSLENEALIRPFVAVSQFYEGQGSYDPIGLT